jgi:serine protease Do
MGFLQLLADSEFLNHLKALRGTAAPRAAAREAERSRIQEQERIAAEAERRAREREEAERARWGRTLPVGSQVLLIDLALRNPVDAGSGIDWARQSVVTLMTEEGSGSGFLISTDGLAITNRHVAGTDARPGDILRARFPSGVEVPARVMRVSPTIDVALVQVICEQSCRTLDVSTEAPEIGSDVWLVGSPLGLDFSVSRGVVSSLRFLDGATIIQTDAASNAGSSGGPLIGVGTGTVSGVLTFGLRESAGLNFAILARDALASVGVQIR